MPQPADFALGRRLANWRKHQGLSLERVADAAAVSVDALFEVEAGLADPIPALRYRLNEMMRYGGDEQLELRRHVISGLMSYVLLMDVDDLRLVAVSAGLARLWPELSRLVNHPFLSHMVPEARTLMQDAGFRGRIKRGDIVLASGASERATDRALSLGRRHRWTVTFHSFGTRVIGEVWYDPEPTALAVGVHEVRTFDEIVTA